MALKTDHLVSKFFGEEESQKSLSVPKKEKTVSFPNKSKQKDDLVLKFFGEEEPAAKPQKPSEDKLITKFFGEEEETPSLTQERPQEQFFEPQQKDELLTEQQKPGFLQKAKDYFSSGALGEAALYQQKSGGYAGAPTLTPKQAKKVAAEVGSIAVVEAAFAPVLGVAARSFAPRLLTSLTRLTQAGATGAATATASKLVEEGELPSQEELLKDGLTWMAIDAVLQTLHVGFDFGAAIKNIAEKEGVPATKVLNKLWDSTKNYVKSKFGRSINTPEDITPLDVEILADEVKEIESSISRPFEPEVEPEAPKTLDESVQQKVVSSAEVEEEKPSLKERFQDYEARFINQYAPLDRLGEEGETFENPGKLAELVEGASGQAKQALELGQFDIETLETTGPALRQIFEPKRILEVEGKKKLDRKAFRAYLAARSSLDRAKLGQKTAISTEEAKAYLEKHKRYEPLARDYTNFLNQNLTNLRKAGMLTPQVEKAMKEMYLNYAPLHRLVNKPKKIPFKTRTLQPEKLPKKAKGSKKTIIDPLESAIKNTAASYRAIAKNRVMNAVRDRLEPLGYKAKPASSPEYGKVHLEELMGETDIPESEANQLSAMKGVLDPESYAPGNGKIFGYRDGKRWEMEAPQEVIDAVKGLNPAQSSFVLGMANKWRGIFSSGIVLQPGTMLRLSGMDLVVTTLQSKYPEFPVLDLPLNVFYHFPRMMLEVFKKGELYQDYMKSGAAQFALQGLDREQLESMVTSITNSERLQEYGLSDLAKDTLKLPWTSVKAAWKALGKVSEKLGDANRLIEFEKSYKNALGRGLSRSQALAQAAHDAFEVSVPYGRMGNSAALQEMYKVVPFMRTIVNSNMTFAQAMDPRNPNFLKMLATALAALTLPTLYFYMKNRNDERYQRIPQEDRDRNIYIFTGEDPSEEPIKLRKLWQYGFVFQTLPERVVEFMAQKDPEAFEKLFKNLEYEFSPFTFLSISSALEDGIHPDKLLEGHRFSIIPQKQKRIDASLQHTQNTTQIARKLGALTNISPLYVDFAIGQVGGGLGNNIARLMDEAFYFTKPEEERRPEAKKADNALWGTFFARGPAKSSEHLNRFYNLHDKMQMYKASVKQLEKEGKFEEALKFAKEHPYVETNKMRTQVGKYYKLIDQVLARPATTESERKKKRVELDRIYIDMARDAKAYEMAIVNDLYYQKHGFSKKKK